MIHKSPGFSQSIVPTHTFETAEGLEIDVLIVPGGLFYSSLLLCLPHLWPILP